MIKILDTMKLKFSSFENLNDLNEIEVNFPIDDFYLDVTFQDFIIKECRVISFSRDLIRNSRIVEFGYDHPRMWAQYSRDHSGACIVLNERRVLEKNNHLLNPKFSKIENVVYENWVLSENRDFLRDESLILKNRYRDLFFKKHKDWKHERERRLFVLGDVQFLDILGCIEYICLGSRFSKEHYYLLINLMISQLKNGNQTLRPHDFALQTNTGGRILPLDNASKILEFVKNKQDEFLHYIDHLNKNGYRI